MHTPSRPIAYLCLALSMSLVGSYVALSKPLAAIFPVMLLAWLRFGIGAVAMLGWLRPPAHETTLTRQTKWLLFFESFFGNFLFTLCMISGVALTSAVTAGVTMAAIPAAVAIMSWLFLREAVGARTWTAIAFAVAGIGLNALSKTESSSLAAHPQQGLGQLLLIAAVLCEAAYAVIGKSSPPA
jgi:drug/metabolite transporter (DMT)-like permease